MLRKFILLLFHFFFLSPYAHGSELGGVSTTIHHHYQSPRALGMGGAFVAVANDYTALFYNPAGLARLESTELNLSLDGGVSENYFKLSRDIKSASNTNGSETEKQLAIVEVIEAAYGKTNGARLMPASAIYASRGWGMGFIPVDLSLELIINRSIGPSMNTTVYVDSTFAMGWAKDVHWIPNSRLSVGVTGKFVNRLYYSKTLSFIDLAINPDLFKKEDFTEGYTADADLGMLLTPELPPTGLLSLLRLARPSFGVVLRNVGEIGFSRSLRLVQKTETEAPEKLFRVLDVGTKWEYPRAWIFSGRGVMDVKNIMHPAFNSRKALHLGFEFDWVMSSLWKGAYRFGMNQGYFSIGASAKLLIFNLDIASYGEDVGTYTSPKENRVYIARLNMNF